MPSDTQTLSIDIPSLSHDPVFSPLQWLVVAMGARRGSVPLALSPFGRALLDMVAGDAESIDGDRLETLRRAAGVARQCGWSMPAIEVGTFLRAGWSEGQLEALIESVGAMPCENERRTCDPGRGARPATRRSGQRMIWMEMH